MSPLTEHTIRDDVDAPFPIIARGIHDDPCHRSPYDLRSVIPSVTGPDGVSLLRTT